MKTHTLPGRCAGLLLALLAVAPLAAQTPSDGLMMARGTACGALFYSQQRWENYWEGATRRNNPNLGTFGSRSVMAMAALGITDRLNVLAALPYVQTRASASYMQGQRGLQDVSAWLKYRVLEQAVPLGTLRVFATGGVSVPVTNYVADFLPFSIGMRSRTASARVVADYLTKPGFYLTAQAGYTRRGNVRIDRDAYLYDNKLYYTNEVMVPDLADGTVRVGFRNKHFQTDVWLDRFASLSGDDIRYNEMPFLTNAMKATTVGWYGRFNWRQLSVTGSVGRVVAGRNVGQGTSVSVGVLYAFRVFGHGEVCRNPNAPMPATPDGEAH